MPWIWPVENKFAELGRMIIRRTIFSLALIDLVLGGWSPAAQASESASRFVQQLGEQAINVLQDDGISLAQREIQFCALLIEGFDLNLIGRFVLGRAWKTADEGQRQNYLRAFGEFIVRKYSAMLGGYAGETMTVVSEQAGDRSPLAGEGSRWQAAHHRCDGRRHQHGSYPPRRVQIGGATPWH